MKKKLISLKEFLLVDKLADYDQLWSANAGFFAAGDPGHLTHDDLNNDYLDNLSNFEVIFIAGFSWRKIIRDKGSVPMPIKIGCSFEVEWNHHAQLMYPYDARTQLPWDLSTKYRHGIRCWRYDFKSMWELMGEEIG